MRKAVAVLAAGWIALGLTAGATAQSDEETEKALEKYREMLSDPMANPGFGKRGAPDQRPRTGDDFAHLPEDEASLAVFIDRLPEHLRILLRGFCFKDEASLAHAVGALLTGLLVNHFQVCGKPMFLIDGNQPG